MQTTTSPGSSSGASLSRIDSGPSADHARVPDASRSSTSFEVDSISFSASGSFAFANTALMTTRSARRNVIAEAWRLLRPGGMVVIEDSAQRAESPRLAFFLANFSEDFHEPYHRDYVEDDLAALLAAQGFDVESVEPHFVSKVVVARRPVED